MRSSSGLEQGTPVYIIDGYNVILNRSYLYKSRKDRGGRGLDFSSSAQEARNRFLVTLSNYVCTKRVKVTVVWDGRKDSGMQRRESRNGVTCIYTVTESADTRIVRMVEQMKNRKRVRVVSDDRRHITGIVRNLGAQSMSVDAFLALVEGRRGKRKMLHRGHSAVENTEPDFSVEKRRADDLTVDEWLELFSSKR